EALQGADGDGRGGDDLVAAVPDGGDAGLQRQGGKAVAPRLAHEADGRGVGVDAGAGEGGGEGLSRADAVHQPRQPLAAWWTGGSGRAQAGDGDFGFGDVGAGQDDTPLSSPVCDGGGGTGLGGWGRPFH